MGKALSGWAVCDVVQQSAQEIGIARFGIHDLRGTCAKPCRKAGGDLESLKFLLGQNAIPDGRTVFWSEQRVAVAVMTYQVVMI